MIANHPIKGHSYSYHLEKVRNILFNIFCVLLLQQRQKRHLIMSLSVMSVQILGLCPGYGDNKLLSPENFNVVYLNEKHQYVLTVFCIVFK